VRTVAGNGRTVRQAETAEATRGRRQVIRNAEIQQETVTQQVTNGRQRQRQ